jgi:hypothetical protein
MAEAWKACWLAPVNFLFRGKLCGAGTRGLRAISQILIALRSWKDQCPPL